MHIRTNYALSAAALVISVAAATPSFAQGYVYMGPTTYYGGSYYGGSPWVGSRYVGARYYAGSPYRRGAVAAYASVNGYGYGLPYRRYSYSGWYEPAQRSDPDGRIGGSFKASDHNNDD